MTIEKPIYCEVVTGRSTVDLCLTWWFNRYKKTNLLSYNIHTLQKYMGVKSLSTKI